MSSDRLQRVEQILFHVLELPAGERPAEIEQLCAGDAELSRDVSSLLAQADAAGRFLESPALGSSLADLAFDAPSCDDGAEDLGGHSLGPYRIERRIAAGGMGAVYAASRADGQYTQRVAIKVVKRGMDSDEILRRFKLERQALAALTHPNIARLMDGGVTSDGRPYLVMELVEGHPIDAFADERRFPLSRRLALFRDVCDAVRFAHQHLIIHRDLKPGNILVTPDGEPKLLDFGIAKVLSRDDTVLYGPTTRREEQRLTPEYASPEQLQGARVGTATDTYSLGVILYVLLCGRRPYSVPMLAGDAFARLLREQPPPAPSLAVAREDLPSPRHAAERESPASIARARSSTPDRLARQLRGDLDTIVLAAMHPDPLRRYQSVEALIADIDRYLGGLPISARKDSTWYRVRKFAHRHAMGLSASALIALTLAASLVLITIERDHAIEARDQAQAVSGFLKRTLESADPFGTGRGRPDAKIGDVLASAAGRARLEFTSRPRILAAILGSLGRSFMGLGDYPQAETLLNEALSLRLRHAPHEHAELAESKFDLAELYSATGRHDQAAPLAREAMELYRRGGAGDRLIALALNNMASIDRRMEKFDSAEATHRQVIAIRRRMAEAPDASLDVRLDLADSLNNLAAVLRARATRQGDKSPRTWDEIASLMQEAVGVRESALPADHPLVLQAKFNLAVVYLELERSDEAVRLYSDTLDTARRVYPSGHVETARYARNFAQMLQKAPTPEERDAVGRGDAQAAARQRLARMERSAALLIEAVGAFEAKCAPNDPLLITARRWLAHAQRECGLASQARAQLEAAEVQMGPELRAGPDWKVFVEDMLWALTELHDDGAAQRWSAELRRLDTPAPGAPAR